jgi:hypothetical protein
MTTTAKTNPRPFIGHRMHWDSNNSPATATSTESD